MRSRKRECRSTRRAPRSVELLESGLAYRLPRGCPCIPLDHPQLEFAFECRLKFTRVLSCRTSTTAASDPRCWSTKGTFEGPRCADVRCPTRAATTRISRRRHGRVRRRYLLEVDDGTLIYMQNRGFLWGRAPDAMTRLRAWAFDGGPPVPHEDYYLRAQPTFETPKGKHDWLTRHVFVGVGERRVDCNFVRYYAVT